MRHRILLLFLVFVLGLLPFETFSQEYNVKEISLLSINSAITPATYDYLSQNFKSLPRTSLVVLKLNTPGGLVTTTKDIITMIGREERPLVVWITPEGASASSAGAIIASAAHFIFMSPGTNMGAATPVGLGEDIKEGDGRKKSMNDLSAMVRSLSTSRGRPAAPFEKMISHAESYTDKEALDLKIINGIVSRTSEMVDMLAGKEFIIGGVKRVLTFEKGSGLVEYGPSLGQKILEVLANPSTAYFLFLIGIALIYFEFQTPGGFVAGSIGLVCLILASIAFQVLPLDWGSFGLIILGIGLLISELFITSYGLLGIAGVISFVMGSLFLFHGETGFISIQYKVILSTLAGVGTSIGLIVWYLWKNRRKHSQPSSFFLPVGSFGTILTNERPGEFQIKVKGEIWNAKSSENLMVGDKVEVLAVNTEKLNIQIKKA